MSITATVELRDLVLDTVICYGPADGLAQAHLLDLTLHLSQDLVLVAEDSMAHVFDYDPLVARIDAMSRGRQFATQEFLMTQVVAACLQEPQITAVEVALRKRPVLDGTGTLGLRLMLSEAACTELRAGLARDAVAAQGATH
ncbi:MAG: dihydroneopterin aldolase [Roseinatronobacter sp.]